MHKFQIKILRENVKLMKISREPIGYKLAVKDGLIRTNGGNKVSRSNDT